MGVNLTTVPAAFLSVGLARKWWDDLCPRVLISVAESISFAPQGEQKLVLLEQLRDSGRATARSTI